MPENEPEAPDDLIGLMSPRQLRDALETAFSLAVRRAWPLAVVKLEVDPSRGYDGDIGRSVEPDVLRVVTRVIAFT